MTKTRSPFLSDRAPVCPPDLLTRAQANPAPRVAIARAGSALVMEAARDATNLGIMTPIFTGERDDIKREADRLDWDISRFEIIDATGELLAGQAAASACGSGHADVLMKGQIASDLFLKTALDRTAGLRTGARLVHIFHVSHPDGGRPLLLSDGAVNITPDMETLKSSTRAVVELAQKLGNAHPRVAFLSASEKPLPAMPSAVQARTLRDWARAEFPDALFSGPLALDLILSKKSAEIKGLIDDPVAGLADAVVVPDIVSGNVLFKSLVYLTGGCAAGLILGAKVPLLLTSRADPAAARLASAALASLACGSR